MHGAGALPGEGEQGVAVTEDVERVEQDPERRILHVHDTKAPATQASVEALTSTSTAMARSRRAGREVA